MTANEPARRKDVAALLESAGYELQERRFAESETTVAATPYALVACVELDGWGGLDQRVSDIQAGLTELAEEAPSARSWDLYLVVLVADAPTSADQRALAESIERSALVTSGWGPRIWTRRFGRCSRCARRPTSKSLIRLRNSAVSSLRSELRGLRLSRHSGPSRTRMRCSCDEDGDQAGAIGSGGVSWLRGKAGP